MMNPALARHLQTLDLERVPFPPTPDAAAWFQTRALESGLTEAAHCLRTRAGFVLLTGEIGTGKSTFLRRLLHALDNDGVVTSMVFNTFLQGADLLAAVLRDFGLQPQGNPAADIETLNRFLVQRWQQHTTCVLVIDDAQNLSLESLELLRLLTNLETGQEKLLQIVLAGQPELRDNLEQPAIRQLTSRICTHVQLDVLGVMDIGDYVEFRLRAAGNPANGITLQPGAAIALHQASGGNPRRVHLIMDRCLYGLYGRAPGQRDIDAALVRTAAAEAGARPARQRPRLPLALAASLGGLLALGAGLLALRSGESHAEPAPINVTAATATTTEPDDTHWQSCLQRFAGRPIQQLWVDESSARALREHGRACLRQHGERWQAAWEPGLDADQFSDPRITTALQQVLREHGHYDGAIDGRDGPLTRRALARFQRQHRLPASAAPDPLTLHLLDSALTSRSFTASNTDSALHGQP